MGIMETQPHMNSVTGRLKYLGLACLEFICQNTKDNGECAKCYLVVWKEASIYLSHLNILGLTG